MHQKKFIDSYKKCYNLHTKEVIMSKFTKFILFNIIVYVAYLLIDKVFTFLGLFSNPQLGHDLMVMPTNGDIWLILINSLVSSVVAFYLLFKIEERLGF